MNRTSKEELEKLILIDKLSYAEIARTFGVSDVTIRTWAIKLGINIPSRKKILENKICLNCNNEFKPSGTTNKYCSQPNPSNVSRSPLQKGNSYPFGILKPTTIFSN